MPRGTPCGALNTRGVWKIWDFRPKSPFISETVPIFKNISNGDVYLYINNVEHQTSSGRGALMVEAAGV